MRRPMVTIPFWSSIVQVVAVAAIVAVVSMQQLLSLLLFRDVFAAAMTMLIHILPNAACTF